MNFTLPEDLERSVLAVVDGDRFPSANEVVTEAVRGFLRQYRPPRQMPEGETALDAFKRLGIIGSVKSKPGSPRDLSTNPIHMEGFGEHAQD